MTAFAKALIEKATAEIGVREERPNGGKRVDQYQAASWLAPKHWGPWCATFVCWVIREVMKDLGMKDTATFSRPQTAAAFGFERWSRAQGSETWTKNNPGRDIEAGDIIIFGFSHIGFATSAPDRNGNFQTVEGNTNGEGSREGDGVYAKRRNISLVRSRIRFREFPAGK
ncbi:CHAP domain containing protein [uncultured Caudovirales phage]|uniref:CHAP domain containing protein n=1 Tax=uncultured Caudovirales phage TaxID=2100421 RepID=A0A6J5P2P1_9CAUD|nr:CHAP domain containing protein [uncultured Caudovirales phage]